MKKFLVVGLGETGKSILRYLTRHGQQAVGFDTRAQMKDKAAIEREFAMPCFLAHTQDLPWDEITDCIVSPGVALDSEVIRQARTRQLPIIGDIELFYHEAKAPIIAITGTNAKSTVTTLVTNMINASGKRAKMGGNIGIPALDLLTEAPPDYYVLELSSFQLDLLADFKAYIGVVLNISIDHLDRHGSFAAYQKAKERIYHNCTYAVVNRALNLMNKNIAIISQGFSFGLDQPMTDHAFGLITHEDQGWLAEANTRLMRVSELSRGLSGRHNVENALSALAITAPLQLSRSSQLKVLQDFQGLAHRCVWVREFNGVEWYNDSKGTNVGATLAAIQGIGSKAPGRLILLLGGLAKNQDFSALCPAIQGYVREVIIYGSDQSKIAEDLAGISCKLAQGSFVDIVNQAKQLAVTGDIVLFSPACASYDMFKDFEDRGCQFTEIVKAFQREDINKIE